MKMKTHIASRSPLLVRHQHAPVGVVAELGSYGDGGQSSADADAPALGSYPLQGRVHRTNVLVAETKQFTTFFYKFIIVQITKLTFFNLFLKYVYFLILLLSI